MTTEDAPEEFEEFVSDEAIEVLAELNAIMAIYIDQLDAPDGAARDEAMEHVADRLVNLVERVRALVAGDEAGDEGEGE